MTPERLAEITAIDAYERQHPLPHTQAGLIAEHHRGELLAELGRLRSELANAQSVPRCGATTPSVFINEPPIGPCIFDHGHDGMHQAPSPVEWPGYPGARWTNTPAAPAPASRVWIIDCTYQDTISVYVTEEAARTAAEAYVREHAQRQPITDIDWRYVPDDEDGSHELWGMVDGRMYPANMIVYSLPVRSTAARSRQQTGTQE